MGRGEYARENRVRESTEIQCKVKSIMKREKESGERECKKVREGVIKVGVTKQERSGKERLRKWVQRKKMRESERQIERHTDRLTYTQTDRQTYRQT